MIDVAVIGSGTMGMGIAQIAATAGHKVFLYDNNPEVLTKALKGLSAILNRLVEKGRMEESESITILDRINFIDELDQIKSSKLVIEAIIENIAIKQTVFKQMEDIVSDDCILATNTSSLSVASIAGACRIPERVIGIHFFNPAPLMKLVEIVPAIQTKKTTVGQVYELINSWKKIPVSAKDTPGFIVNRIARPFYGEALRILEEGLADEATIDWAMTEIAGFRMGPFALMDYIGHDVNYKVTESVFKAFYYDPRYKPSFSQKSLVDAGYLGRKSGKGFFDYAEGAKKPGPVKDEKLGNQIVDRIVIMLINEAADALFLNIASREDIDLAMTKGVNYPKGLLKWADELGIANCVDRMDALYQEYLEDRYRCSPIMRRMTRDDQKFWS
jgi:3-hydroxybutyryl-CoA dehydrogenase